MEDIRYYEDVDRGFLLAYEKTTEFFVIYREETGEWTDCIISFSNFRHDYCYRELGKGEAYEKTNGNLPEALFEKYVALLRG